MREIKYLLRKIREYDGKMIPMILLYTILSAVFPFVWVILPSFVLGRIGRENNNLLMMIGVTIVISALASYIIAFIQGNYRMRMNNIRYQFIRDVISYSLNMPYEYTLREKETEKLFKAREAVSNPNKGAGGAILNILKISGLILSVSGFTSLFFSVSPIIAWVILSGLLLDIFIQKRRLKISKDEWLEVSKVYSKMERLSYEFTNPMSKQDIIVYGFLSLFQTYYKNIISVLRSSIKAFNGRKLNLILAASLFNVFKDIVIFSYLIYSTINGENDISRLYLVLSSVISFSSLSAMLLETASEFKANLVQFSSFIELDNSQFHEDMGLKLANKEKFELEIRNLSFKYKESDKYVLKDINLSIRDGESIALVGENGSGKSTLVNIIARLLTSYEGEILLNGRDIKEYSEREYRKFVSVIFQDASVLPFNIAENVSFLAQGDQDRLNAVYELSGMKAIIEDFEKKDKQVLKRILDDDGLDLSGGQEQRLFLARCLYKEGAEILILDEPTAALDSLAEKEFYETFRSISLDKTSIFISHRLASTKFCDRIIYLMDGEIIEEGSHEELLKKQGKYSELFEIQAKHYREGNHEESNQNA